MTNAIAVNVPAEFIAAARARLARAGRLPLKR